MKMRIYNFLVNRQIGISERYHAMHDYSSGLRRFISYIYLLWLNFCFYVLRRRKVGASGKTCLYEEKELPISQSESVSSCRKQGTVSEMVAKLSDYDIISFDMFDTLILRSVDAPTDVFWFLQEKVGVLNFKELRIAAERRAREKCLAMHHHTEVTLADIWAELSCDIRIEPTQGMEWELQVEGDLCRANPFMLEVWNQLLAMGKRLIVVSDMYLPPAFLEELLYLKGYEGAYAVYVSNQHGISKASGHLYDLVRAECRCEAGVGARLVHVGDNPVSDVLRAREHGVDAVLYHNVHALGDAFRCTDMSAIVGSAYRGVVNKHLHTGMHAYEMEYEYGYIYGGLFAVGYCNFIHEYCRENRVDKILFLSRDGDILKKVFDEMFPDENTAYVFWSRKAATKLMADYDRQDYFRRFLHHKVNQGYTLQQIWSAMELDDLDLTDTGCKPTDILDSQNVMVLQNWLELNWSHVIACYREQQEAAASYYRSVLRDTARAVAVDIGWAGSGAMSLRYLVTHAWNISCEIIGLVAGTNTPFNAEPDASEPFLQSGQLVSYLFSQSQNRDLLKHHDPNRDYNVFWELLLSSPKPQFAGFYRNAKSGRRESWLPDIDVVLGFGEFDKNPEGIMRIQKGIRDFAKEYTSCFEKYPYMYQISGRDAYAPLLLASCRKERYLKAIAQRFGLVKNVE